VVFVHPDEHGALDHRLKSEIMKITAKVENSKDHHQVTLQTNDNVHSIVIPPKSTGYGSSANGGELLFLALATCYCNDIYREAAKRNILVERVEVNVEGDFGAEGEHAKNVTYHAKVSAQASEQEIQDMMRFVDTVAEIQNTLRIETPVVLSEIEVVKV
jgi:uncharacterized OsmC-like protein